MTTDTPDPEEPHTQHARAAATRAKPATAHGVDPNLLDLIVCPFTKQALVLSSCKTELLSPAAGLAFPIRDGIPMLTGDAARRLTEEEETRFKARHR